RTLLHRHLQTRPPDRSVEVGLVEAERLRVEVTLLLGQAVLLALLPRIEEAHLHLQPIEPRGGQLIYASQISQVARGGREAAAQWGLPVLLGVTDRPYP